MTSDSSLCTMARHIYLACIQLLTCAGSALLTEMRAVASAKIPLYNEVRDPEMLLL